MSQENFWKLMGTINKLKRKDKTCFVCGSTENIVPHHINKVKQENDEYYNEDNILLLCDECHHLYHQQYKNVNSKTFCEFMRKYLKNHIQKKKTYKTHFKINSPLKISKLKKILKSVNKTHKKIVKVSVNGKLYDVSKVFDDEKSAVMEIMRG